MADAAFKTHSGQMARRTRGDMRDMVAKSVTGLTAANQGTIASAQLTADIQSALNNWRQRFQGIRGFGRRQWERTWDITQTRHEMPTDFAELGPGGKITLLDTTGTEDTQLIIITKESYEQAWRDGSNHYEDRRDPVGFFFGESTNSQRFFQIRPTPTTPILFRVYGFAFAEVLDNDADVIEAPLGMHEGIEQEAAGTYGRYKGNPRWQEFAAVAERIALNFEDPAQDEQKLQGRILSFEEAGGYAKYSKAIAE